VSGAAWKVESLYFHEADLMTGCAGVLHLLARFAVGNPAFGMPLQLPRSRCAGAW
jgi:hypothetical protein